MVIINLNREVKLKSRRLCNPYPYFFYFTLSYYFCHINQPKCWWRSVTPTARKEILRVNMTYRHFRASCTGCDLRCKFDTQQQDHRLSTWFWMPYTSGEGGMDYPWYVYMCVMTLNRNCWLLWYTYYKIAYNFQWSSSLFFSPQHSFNFTQEKL